MAISEDPEGNIAVAVNNIDAGDAQIESDSIYLYEEVSPSGQRMRELASAREVLTRVELDLAYSSEKVLNLDILLMHVADRASDCEAMTLEGEDVSDDSAEKALEFDILNGILDSEAKELDNFMSSLRREIVDTRQKISLCEHLTEAFVEMEEKLDDSEDSLKQSQDQVSEMRMHSAKFQRSSAFASKGDSDISENGQFSSTSAKVKMQTAEQQRHILRMLEKSLARELDLEKKLSESRHNEEELKLKLHYSEREMFCMEETAEMILERLFEAENSDEVLMGISKELMGKLQIVQFNLNGSMKREAEMRSKLQDSMQKLATEEIASQKLKTSCAELDNFHVLQANSLKASLKEAEDEYIIVNSEAMTLREQVVSLEKQLRESDIQLQHTKSFLEASQEQQNMLYSELNDMENVIEDLKANVLKAESRAENAEVKCKLLAETNLELNEELGFLRGRTESLETSLHQADDAKMATSMGISIRTKTITDLVMQLATERERLEIQISSLTKTNNILSEKCWVTKNDASITMSNNGNDNEKEFVFSRNDFISASSSKAFKGAVTEFSATSFQVDKAVKDVHSCGTEAEPSMSADDAISTVSKLETVRTIDAGQLNWKYVFLAIFVVFIAVLATYLFQLESYPFCCLKRISNPK
eukprot:TRINITY_DN2513_c0_g1_i1.p1 TRINITY_DN2513_c0_g1~~TRINITY_DN2513_c0_g1_i1.p1  ORF type:complete len:670 (-),score=150.16 TRINITY_DN2513_c0_g1_i1:140-2083(-)